MPAHIGREGVARHVANAGLGAQHRAAERLVRIGDFLEMVEDDVVRRVVGLADFLEDHAALALQLLRVEGGMAEDVANDVGAERQILLQHLDVVGGLLARGVGVDVPAHRLDLLGDFGGAAPLGALEGHVFEEVGDAVLRCRLVARAGGDVGTERGGFHPVHPFGDHGEAAGEAGDADGVRCHEHILLWRREWRGMGSGGLVAPGVGADEFLHLGQLGRHPGEMLVPFI